MKFHSKILIAAVTAFSINAWSADPCADYRDGKMSFKFQKSVREDRDLIRKLVTQVYTCTTKKNLAVVAAQADLLVKVQADYPSAQYSKLEIDLVTSWVTTRRDPSGEMGATYGVEIRHPIYASGVGTGMFQGTVENLRSSILVEIMDIQGRSRTTSTVVVNFEGLIAAPARL